MHLAKRQHRVVEMVKNEGHDGVVDGAVIEPIQRVLQVVHPELGGVVCSLSRVAHQFGAAVEGDNIGASSREFLRVHTRAAADI